MKGEHELIANAGIVLPPPAGMKCAGCVSRVKGLLETQPPVVGASVNLATETAMVRVRVPPSAAPLPAAPLAPVADTGSDEGSDVEMGLVPPSPLEVLGQSLAQVRGCLLL